MRNVKPIVTRLITNHSAVGGLISGLCLGIGLACSPANAAIVINTTTPTGIFGNSATVTTRQFSNNGVNLTFLNPGSPNPTTVSRTVAFGTTSLPSGGTCLGGSRSNVSNAVCGNPSNTPNPQINSIDFKFNTDVNITAFTVKARADTADGTPVNTVVSTWNSGFGTPTPFTFTVDTANSDVSAGAFRIKNYNPVFAPIFAKSETTVTVSSSFTLGNMDYWIDSMTVEYVPGPLPVLGLGSAIVWSRKLRRKAKQI